nr:MAG: pectate lyase superfamily protein [Bacteriophage sp.]
MSSGCGDVLSLADLQTAKKHQIFEAEVITGKSGGVAGGADIDYATNQVTGQTQKTLPAVLRDAGFSPVSWDFSTGGTLTVNDRDKVVYDPVSKTWYSYAGTLPVVVPASFNPVGNANWKPQTDPNLRNDLANPDDGLGADLVAYSATEAVRDAISRIDGDMFQDPLTAWPLGGTLKIKQGVYEVTSALVLDYGNYDAAFIGSPGVRAHYEGENMAETIFNCQVADFNIQMYGDSTFTSQRVHAYDSVGGFTLKGSATSYGMHIKGKAYTRLHDFVSYGHTNGEGLRLEDVLTSDVDNVYLQANRIGLRVLASSTGSELNAVSFNRITASDNSNWGVLGDRWGAGDTITGLTCEGNGTQGDTGTGGMNIAVNGLNGSGALVLNNPYFEANKGGADLVIDNTGTRPVTVIINGGNFHRVSSTAYTLNNLSITSSGGGKVTVVLNGTTFQSVGSYVPSSTRPYWVTGPNCEVIDIGCTFMEETSKATSVSSGSIPRSGRINANGSIDVAPGVSSVNVVATGVYDVTFSRQLAALTNGYVVQITPISAPDSVSCDVIYSSTTRFRVTLRNTVSGAGIASAFAFSVTRLV